jgi:hypothetical protein
MGVFKSPRTGEWKMPATSEYLLSNMTAPFISNLGTIIPTGSKDPVVDQKRKADMVSWLSGVRLIPADFHQFSRAQAYAFKNELEAKKSELKERGGELSDQDQDTLDDMEKLIDVVREVEETRDKELYGRSKD